MAKRWLPPLLLMASAGLLTALVVNRPAPLSAAWSNAPHQVQALMWPEARAIEPFRLHASNGAEVGPELFSGQWGFMFFGYLQCPDVCPTTLHGLREFRRLMMARDPRTEAHRFVFVTVDPDNDSVEQLGDYLHYFDPSFIGLGGSAHGLQQLASSLAVKYVVFHDENGVRSIDHTSSVMVINPSGQVVASFPPPHEPQRMLERFEQLRRHLER
jgi:protein SCO1